MQDPTVETLDDLCRTVAQANPVQLFLDYDGTLAEFVKTPDIIVVEPELTDLLGRVNSLEGVFPVILSGRTLAQLQELLPVPGLYLNGTYGIETQFPDGHVTRRLSFRQIRPFVERLKPHWQALISGKKGFFLEDKGWALALHARFAEESEHQAVLGQALDMADELLHDQLFHLVGDKKFLEFVPIAASKARSVRRILSRMTPKRALPLYFGDDDKDEEAFRVIHKAGGYTIRVSRAGIVTRAHFRVDSPQQVRDWLLQFVEQREKYPVNSPHEQT